MDLKRQRPPVDQEFDIVVIGGGINGVAIARECALAGSRVLLLEKNDFASGTTSRSTRIIHGGLRYLERGELGLVREALREREHLLRERPHLVRPLKFVFAINENSRHSAMRLRVGLWLYRQLAGRAIRSDPNVTALEELERQLDCGKKWALFQYDDAQCEYPERLVAEWLTEALSAGATARNHTDVLEIRTTDGRADGVRIRDLLSGAEQFVRADWIINAAGPWIDKVFASSKLNLQKPMVGGVRGSHIVVQRFPEAPHSAIYTEAQDGRPFFVLPWAGQLLIGTTEVPDGSNPDSVRPSSDEISYLIKAFNRLYPSAAISTKDVTFAFAGIRPLPAHDQRDASSVTRRHIIRNHAEEGGMGMLSIIGGKLTTAAELARQTARKIGLRAQTPAQVMVASGTASGIESTLNHWADVVASAAGISNRAARSIAEWHGRRALAITQLARSDERMRQPICEHSDHIVAEAVDAVRHESAITLGDVLLRRVPLALNSCFSGDCARVAAERVGIALQWDSRLRGQMLESFQQERSQFLCKPDGQSSPICEPAGERAA